MAPLKYISKPKLNLLETYLPQSLQSQTIEDMPSKLNTEVD